MIKPILFNADMVRALLANRKTVTRRLVKSLSGIEVPQGKQFFVSPRSGAVYWKGEDRQLLIDGKPVVAPYRPGDILYVRETWAEWWLGGYIYKADNPDRKFDVGCWHPSIHMPREAARIFLRVTDVRVERLQDITEEQAKAEGAIDNRHFIHDSGNEYDTLHSAREHFVEIWNACYAKPRPIKGEDGTIDHYESYPWEDIQETRTYKGKPWYVIGNPWVWVIEFERISREEALCRDT